jgi:hypothetical protein
MEAPKIIDLIWKYLSLVKPWLINDKIWSFEILIVKCEKQHEGNTRLIIMGGERVTNMHEVVLKNIKIIMHECDFFVLSSNEVTMINN